MKSRKAALALILILPLIAGLLAAWILKGMPGRDYETPEYLVRGGKIYYRELWRANITDPDLLYVPKSGFVQVFNWWKPDLFNLTELRFNNDGFRDRDYPVEKNSSVFRIIDLGDSFAYGWGLDVRDTLSKKLEVKLNSLRDNRSYEVLNMGISGNSFNQYIEYYRIKGMKYDPNLIIIQFIEDDFYDNREIMDMMQAAASAENGYLSDLGILDLYLKVKIKYMDAFRRRTHDAQFNLTAITLARLKNLAGDTQVLFIIYPLFNDPLKDRLIQEVDGYGWKHIDLEADLSYDYSNRLLVLNREDRHPSAISNDMVANYTLNYLVTHSMLR